MYSSKIENKVGIIGQNIFVNNGKATAIYLLDSVNYSTLSPEGVKKYVDKLENLANMLAMSRPGVSFSIYQINKTQTAEDVKRNIIDTVKLWDPSYGKIPEMYEKYIEKSVQVFSILCVNLNTNDLGDIESMSFKNVIKRYLHYAATNFFSIDNVSVDSKKLIDSEKSIYDIVSVYCVRASRELTFYNYVSRIYPSYEISYSKNSFVEKNLSSILGVIDQFYKSEFGYFEMKNTGIDIFGHTDSITYGSILNIVKMPEAINSNRFNLNIPGIMITIKTIPKDKAKLMVKRARADMEFEAETAEDADARDTEELDSNLDLAERALKNIANGNSLCETKISILILSKNLKDLKTKRQRMITKLADIGILAAISENQALDYVNNYIKMSPLNYNHLCDLRYPLSFQINNGSQVGDSDSRFSSPAIGEDISK